MRLEQLVRTVPGAVINGDGALDIRALAYDSRLVTPGGLFVAIRGFARDGLEFVPDAISRGAVAVVSDRPCEADITRVLVSDSRWALGAIAAEFFGHPSRRLMVIGVTGTNGKTTTTHMIRSILEADGRLAGVIGTVGATLGEDTVILKNTTPESLDVQRTLAGMLDRGADAAVMEVSSHALVLGRAADVDFQFVAFTNLTPEHLDFHRDLEDYRAAKARLFSRMRPAPGRMAIVNADSPDGDYMARASTVAVLTFGFEQPADVRGRIVRLDSRETIVQMQWTGNSITVRLAALGRFNAENALAAAAVAIASGVDAGAICQGLEKMRGVPGRFERVAVDGTGLPAVVVDYAHTPDGLDKILRAARECSDGRVIAVFGCGGDRDRTKRPVMGEIGARLADVEIITSDNPRSEDPEQIVRSIEQGAIRAGGKPIVIVDRAQAIRHAINIAQPEDIVVIAGKGHETYQIIGERTLSFDDREQARAALGDRAGAGG